MADVTRSDLAELCALLRAQGVTHFEGLGVKLVFLPAAVAAEQEAPAARSRGEAAEPAVAPWKRRPPIESLPPDEREDEIDRRLTRTPGMQRAKESA